MIQGREHILQTVPNKTWVTAVYFQYFEDLNAHICNVSLDIYILKYTVWGEAYKFLCNIFYLLIFINFYAFIALHTLHK